MIILQAVQVVIASIPGLVLDMINGYQFDPLFGSLFSLIGIIIWVSNGDVAGKTIR